MIGKKNTFLRLGMVVVLFICLFQIGMAKEEPTVINLYTSGSDNVRITWETVIKAFAKQNHQVEVHLQHLSSGTGGQSGIDRLIAATKAGQKTTDIDILEAGDNDLVKIIAEAGPNTLAPLTKKQVPGLKNVVVKAAVGRNKAVPYRGTTVLLAYNSATVKNPPQTAEQLYQWIKKHPGRFAYNDPTTGGAGSSFVLTAVYNKLPAEALTSIDPKWKEKWGLGLELLKQLHPYFYKASGKVQYPAKNQGTIDLLANGEVDMIPAWADMILDQKSRGLLPPSIKLTQIRPAFTGNLVWLTVPTLSQHKKAAYQLLNFAVSAEGQQIFVETQKAIPVINKSKLSPKTMELLSGLKVKEFRSYTIGELSNQLNKTWQNDIATLK